MHLTLKIFHRLIYLRLFLVSLLVALILSLVSLFTVVRVSDLVVEDYRYGYLMFIAKTIEKAGQHKPLHRVNLDKLPLALNTDDPYSLFEATEFALAVETGGDKDHRGNQPLLWIVDQEGRLLSTNTDRPLPLSWKDLPHPQKVHAIASTDSILFKPRTFIIKLDTDHPAYLVSHNAGFLFQGPFLWIQGAHTFATAALAMFFALSITFFYLRRKSRSARAVLARLEAGDLKARFEMKRFDEFGSLMYDFNRMASQIEGLVKKVNDAERSRSNLLQELGHDVRTPLTSLSTSFETLKAHHEELSLEDREELYSMLGADIRYFRHLLEQLTVVATIDVPRYKSTTEKIDLSEILSSELKSRQALMRNLRWEIDTPETEATMLGDPHLITRLFRNALDNASRYANQAVKVSVESCQDKIEVHIMDDGPGLSEEAISSFGKRRERRQVRERDAENFSLGLGSVIMKAIADVHDGFVTINNLSDGMKGACVKVTFRRK